MWSGRRWCAVAVAVSAVLGAASCSRTDSAPPVASLAVTTARPRVPIGGPLELTYKFEVLPDAQLNGDYQVFLHLVNAEGRTIWNDDHAPSVPTSQWKPGQVIEYSRLRFLPATGLTPGPVAIRAGLYRDERLPLRAGADTSADRAYDVASLELAPEAENVFLIYTSGWHGEERADAQGPAWTWTDRRAVLSFRNPKADVTFYLEYDARPDAFGGQPQQVTVSVGGQVIETFAADRIVPTLRRTTIPAAALGTDDMAELRIEVDRVFVPAALPAGGRDQRSLGIKVYHAYVERR